MVAPIRILVRNLKVVRFVWFNLKTFYTNWYAYDNTKRKYIINQLFLYKPFFCALRKCPKTIIYANQPIYSRIRLAIWIFNLKRKSNMIPIYFLGPTTSLQIILLVSPYRQGLTNSDAPTERIFNRNRTLIAATAITARTQHWVTTHLCINNTIFRTILHCATLHFSRHFLICVAMWVRDYMCICWLPPGQNEKQSIMHRSIALRFVRFYRQNHLLHVFGNIRLGSFGWPFVRWAPRFSNYRRKSRKNHTISVHI